MLSFIDSSALLHTDLAHAMWLHWVTTISQVFDQKGPRIWNCLQGFACPLFGDVRGAHDQCRVRPARRKHVSQGESHVGFACSTFADNPCGFRCAQMFHQTADCDCLGGERRTQQFLETRRSGVRDSLQRGIHCENPCAQFAGMMAQVRIDSGLHRSSSEALVSRKWLDDLFYWEMCRKENAGNIDFKDRPARGDCNLIQKRRSHHSGGSSLHFGILTFKHLLVAISSPISC